MIACPDCGSVSHHPRDLAEGYCGKCHDWTMAPRVTVDVAPPDIFQWWTMTEVARYLGIEPSTARAYLGRGQMPAAAARIGRLSFWRPEDIRAWRPKETDAPPPGGP